VLVTAAIVATMVLRFGYKFVPYWPLLVK